MQKDSIRGELFRAKSPGGECSGELIFCGTGRVYRGERVHVNRRNTMA